ncbi:MAG: DUF3524 domain-containing protein [Anaerolineae bacterium]|nr:DUF3524 domain-containing protein [Anaerolineae bacterium]
MHILYVESHYEGAHRDWIDSYRARSQHTFTLLTMPGGDWRWRLHGGALHLAREFLAQRPRLVPVDLLLINGMVNAPLFLAATHPHLAAVPLAVYFQENQLTYPPEPGDRLLWQDGFVNVMSAYVADLVGFNGAYLQQDFLTSLAAFVTDRQDYPADIISRITARSQVLPRGIDLRERFGPPPRRQPPQAPLTLLWSHRWAYEKGVEDFAVVLRQLHQEGWPFEVILAGDPWRYAGLKAELTVELGDRVVMQGLLQGADYVEALRRADVIVAPAQNEPLGVSVLEALYMGCFPVLPARGSFPWLLPPEQHDLLYDGSQAGLLACLRALLSKPESAYRPALQAVGAAHDWGAVIQHYDTSLAVLGKYSFE